jgi:hypothetical protein
MRAATCLAATLLALTTPAVAQAPAGDAGGCRLIMDVMNSRWSIDNFDPYGFDVPFKQFQVAFTNTGSAPCTGALEADLLGEPYGLLGPSRARVPYTLVDEEGARDLTPRTGRSPPPQGGRPLLVGPGETVTRFLSFTVDGSRVRGDGLFAQTLRLSATNEAFDLLASRDLSLELDVEPSVSVRLAGAIRGRATVELGELTQGVHESPLQVQVQSTRSYVVGMVSENRGRLSLGETGWQVPYAVVLDGVRHDLSEPAVMNVTRVREGADHYDLAFDVGSVDGVRAGRYTDVITISVQPM